MRPNVVVDIGNTRIKWGLCAPDAPRVVRTASLPDDPTAWAQALGGWRAQPPLADLSGPLRWVLTSVQPARCEHLRGWLEGRGERVGVLSLAAQLPLQVAVPKPDHVGIDRLLDAVAARQVLPPGQGAVLVDAGSAVTVDWLDEGHVFRGGAIFPGVRMMAEALHAHTALLPLVSVTYPIPQLPADATIPAMQAGIFLAVSGGIREAVRHYEGRALTRPQIFLTGGDAGLLVQALGLDRPGCGGEPWCRAVYWPNQTLEGILHSAENLP
jgi:type III pantothenate kinase